MPTKRELLQTEEAAWAEFAAALGSLSDAQIEQVGYYPGWSVKDLMSHVGCWQAEAHRQLQRMAAGSYRAEPLDVEGRNAEFLQAMRPCTLDEVRAECHAARSQMLAGFDAFPEPPPEAVEWFAESGADHYAEHLPRLRAWIEELAPRA